MPKITEEEMSILFSVIVQHPESNQKEMDFVYKIREEVEDGPYGHADTISLENAERLSELAWEYRTMERYGVEWESRDMKMISNDLKEQCESDMW